MSVLLAVGFVVCVIAAVLDMRTGLIPNRLTYPLLVLSPPAHVVLVLVQGGSFTDALLRGGTSVIGIIACGILPLFMWKNDAIGGGDLKLFAGLGGLLLPRFGFETQLYVLLSAALIAPIQLAYRGTLFRALRNVVGQFLNPLRKKERRVPLHPAMASWLRLGPCFALGFSLAAALQWRAPW